MEWAFVAGMALVLAASILGYLAARPTATLERERADREAKRADEAESVVAAVAASETERRRGGQADADHDAAVRAALASAPPGDVRAAARRVLDVIDAREHARAAAAGPPGRPPGDHAGAPPVDRGPAG